MAEINLLGARTNPTESKSFNIVLKDCNSTEVEVCGSREWQDKWFQKNPISINYVQAHFDFNSYDRPIRYTWQDLISYRHREK